MHGGYAAAAFWGAINYLFDALHPLGEVEVAAEGFYVGLDFGPLEIHFLTGVVDEAFGESAVDDEGADHVPVAEDLEDVGGLLVAVSNAVDEFFGRRRFERAAYEATRLAHDGFAAEFVEVEEEFGLLDGGFGFWHGENLAGRGRESTVESRKRIALAGISFCGHEAHLSKLMARQCCALTCFGVEESGVRE